MRPPPPLGPSIFARWTSRIALFSVGVLLAAMLLHRLLSLPTPVALNLAAVAFAGAALSILLAIAAAVGVWRTGRPGTSRIVFGTLVSLGLLLWPLIYLPTYERLPKINDLTTDPTNPPAFETLAKLRGPGANSPNYPGAAFARAQAKAYPDIKPIEINRSVDEAFELVVDAIRRLKMTIARQEAPDLETGRPGMIEAVDRTLIWDSTTTWRSASPATTSMRASMSAPPRATARMISGAMRTASARSSRRSSCAWNRWCRRCGPRRPSRK